MGDNEFVPPPKWFTGRFNFGVEYVRQKLTPTDPVEFIRSLFGLDFVGTGVYAEDGSQTIASNR